MYIFLLLVWDLFLLLISTLLILSCYNTIAIIVCAFVLQNTKSEQETRSWVQKTKTLESLCRALQEKLREKPSEDKTDKANVNEATQGWLSIVVTLRLRICLCVCLDLFIFCFYI